MLIAALVTGVLLAVVNPITTPAAAAGDIGYRGASYAGTPSPPTADKPQSKLWFHAGSWWADMFDTSSGDWHIFRLDRSTQRWVDTGTLIDERADTHADVLWDGAKLYVASHVVTTSSDTTVRASYAAPARLYRYSWTGSGYSLDSGFPAQISGSTSESLTIDRDTTGVLWATWTQVAADGSAAVYANSSSVGGGAWGTPFVVPVAGNRPAADDISAVVAYGKSRIGVMWSNQYDDAVYWAVHKDGDARTSWSGGFALKGNKQADDHISLKTIQADSAGRVVATVKTAADDGPDAAPTDALIKLLVFKPGTGNWSVSTVGTVSDCQTRPMVMLDETNYRVHVLMAAPTNAGCPYSGYAGTIYDKTASLDNPVFSSGRGTPVLRSTSSDSLNDVTSTKQSVTAASGLVLLASESSAQTYWHADLALPGSTTTPPSSAAISLVGATTAGQAATTAVRLTKPSGHHRRGRPRRELLRRPDALGHGAGGVDLLRPVAAPGQRRHPARLLPGGHGCRRQHLRLDLDAQHSGQVERGRLQLPRRQQQQPARHRCRDRGDQRLRRDVDHRPLHHHADA